jgi:glycerate kinase
MIATDPLRQGVAGNRPAPFPFAFASESPHYDVPSSPLRDQSAAASEECPTILIAASAINESIDAARVADAIAEGVRASLPSARVMQTPSRVTGTGLMEEIVAIAGGTIERVRLLGPHGEDVIGHFGLFGPAHELTAVIAVGEAVELASLPPARRDFTSASSRNTGQLMAAAMDRGAGRIIIGCGDSGAYDGGIGMASALGVRFLDSSRAEITEAGGLLRLATIDLSHRDRRLDEMSIEVVVDPDNDLLGPQGIARLHAPRGGASEAQVLRLEQGLARYAAVVRQSLGIDVAGLPGGGASGGLAAGLVAFVGARLTSARAFAKHDAALQACLAAADIVIVVKDSLDANSLDATVDSARHEPAVASGKILTEHPAPDEVPSWVVRQARAQGLPVIALTADLLLDDGGTAADAEAVGVIAPVTWAGNHPMLRIGTRLRDVSVTAIRKLLAGWQRRTEAT